jgi:(p)ppGpp synthase/HD superfamily hydrolase
MTLTPEEQAAQDQLDRAVRIKEGEHLMAKAAALAQRYLLKKRRDGTPMLEHAARVATQIASSGAPIEIILAALLHDILEEAPAGAIQVRDLAGVFGKKTADLIVALTKNAKNDRKYLIAVEAGGRGAVIIKLVDNADNLMSLEHVKRPAQYVRYGEKIQAIGRRVLGDNDTFVLHHHRALQRAKLILSSMPA